MLRKQFVSAVDLTTALYTTPFIKIKKYGLTFRRKKNKFFLHIQSKPNITLN